MSTWSELKTNPRLRQIYKQRLSVISLIKRWFEQNEFLEVDTPIALRYPGQEPYLNPITVKFEDPKGRTEQFYLQTSPEFSLKKLLAADFEKIFQICKCFRNQESFGGAHNTEFTMLEWYRAPGGLEEIMADTENLFKYISKELGVAKAKNCEVNCEWEKKSMRQIWREYVGVELNGYLTVESIRVLADKLGCGLAVSSEYEDHFYKIFLNKIESQLGVDKPIFVYDYPAQMCSLSRASEDARYAERFELYINGLELANAFGELTDADQQMENLEKDLKLRRKLGKEIWPVDPDFITALRSGVNGGRAGGCSLGIDRMVMFFTGASDINEVVFQSVSDQLSI